LVRGDGDYRQVELVPDHLGDLANRNAFIVVSAHDFRRDLAEVA
jgi:hypothetical protein